MCFVRARAQCPRVRNGRQTALEEFAVGRVANDAQLKIVKSQTIELLMQFIASSHLSFRQAGGDPFWNVIHSAMELVQAPCPGRPRAKPEDILFVAGPQGCGEGVHWDRWHAIRRCCECLPRNPPRRDHPRRCGDVSSSPNALVRGVKPLLVQVCGDFGGWGWGVGVPPLPATVLNVSFCGGEIAGFICNGLSAQTNTVDPNCESCFFKGRPAHPLDRGRLGAPAERRVPPGIQCINELFGFARERWRNRG
jgi:hypothetical protein